MCILDGIMFKTLVDAVAFVDLMPVEMLSGTLFQTAVRICCDLRNQCIRCTVHIGASDRICRTLSNRVR